MKKTFFKIAFTILISCLCFTLSAKAMEIRIAILDSPNMPPKLWTWSQYEKAYLRGLETVKQAVKKQKIKVIYKHFFYGNNPLDVINEIPKVLKWSPDLILGPHYSNQFLLLKPYIKNILTLSSYASDKSVYLMPKNFYTLFPPDNVPTEAMADFIYSKYPKRNIIIINRSDCKDCNNISELFKRIYYKKNSKVQIYQNNFAGDISELPSIKPLLKHYKAGDIIVAIVVNLYNYTDLVNRITALSNKSFIFVSSEDNWGNPNNGLPISPNVNSNYQVYLINPFYFDIQSSSFRTFNKNYLELYGAYPNETVSYVTFMTIMSAIKATYNCPYTNANISTREKLLKCYLFQLHSSPNWFRPSIYVTYKLGRGTGEMIDKTNMIKYFPK